MTDTMVRLIIAGIAFSELFLLFGITLAFFLLNRRRNISIKIYVLAWILFTGITIGLCVALYALGQIHVITESAAKIAMILSSLAFFVWVWMFGTRRTGHEQNDDPSPP